MRRRFAPRGSRRPRTTRLRCVSGTGSGARRSNGLPRHRPTAGSAPPGSRAGCRAAPSRCRLLSCTPRCTCRGARAPRRVASLAAPAPARRVCIPRLQPLTPCADARFWPRRRWARMTSGCLCRTTAGWCARTCPAASIASPAGGPRPAAASRRWLPRRTATGRTTAAAASTARSPARETWCAQAQMRARLAALLAPYLSGYA